jgi:hypothetical protein
VAKFKGWNVKNFTTPKAAAKLILRCSFWCDQIQENVVMNSVPLRCPAQVQLRRSTNVPLKTRMHYLNALLQPVHLHQLFHRRLRVAAHLKFKLVKAHLHWRSVVATENQHKSHRLNQHLVPYLQHSIFFAPYECTK